MNIEEKEKSENLTQELGSLTRLLNLNLQHDENIESCMIKILITLKKLSHISRVDFNKLNDKTNL